MEPTVKPPDPTQFQRVIDEVANALQAAVLITGRLATNLRTDADDAAALNQAIRNATAALQQLRPKDHEGN